MESPNALQVQATGLLGGRAAFEQRLFSYVKSISIFYEHILKKAEADTFFKGITRQEILRSITNEGHELEEALFHGLSDQERETILVNIELAGKTLLEVALNALSEICAPVPVLKESQIRALDASRAKYKALLS